MLQSSSEWGNINEIIRVTIKSLTDTVHCQGLAIREMDRTIRQKFGINELNPLLNEKANNSEISNALNKINYELENRPTNDNIIEILKDKVDKKEFMYYFNSNRQRMIFIIIEKKLKNYKTILKHFKIIYIK